MSAAGTPSKYELPAAARSTCELFRLLAGHEELGLGPGEIAKALKVSPAWASRNLPALAELGFVERVGDTGRWRLGVAFVRIATTVATNLAAARRRIDELQGRYGTPL